MLCSVTIINQTRMIKIGLNQLDLADSATQGLCDTTFGATTLSIMAFSITTLITKGLFVTLSMNDNQYETFSITTH
jgi:hypothetical protein